MFNIRQGIEEFRRSRLSAKTSGKTEQAIGLAQRRADLSKQRMRQRVQGMQQEQGGGIFDEMSEWVDTIQQSREETRQSNPNGGIMQHLFPQTFSRQSQAESMPMSTPAEPQATFVSRRAMTPEERKWTTNDPGAPEDMSSAQSRKTSLKLPDYLANDKEFQSELNNLLAKHNMSRQQVYEVMKGESDFDPKAIAAANGKYGGLFMLGMESVGISGKEVAGKSAAEQVRLYDKYLTSINYKGGPLGPYQAAPGVIANYFAKTKSNTLPNNLVLYVRSEAHRQELAKRGYITEYAYAGFGDKVYTQNSQGGKPGTGWVSSDDAITVGSVDRYYRSKG